MALGQKSFKIEKYTFTKTLVACASNQHAIPRRIFWHQLTADDPFLLAMGKSLAALLVEKKEKAESTNVKKDCVQTHVIAS